MNAMPKASTYKSVRSPSANKPATPGSLKRARKATAPAKESPAARQRRMLAEMQVQIRQINATLDEIEQSRRERQAW
jgi:hypothetical protein